MEPSLHDLLASYNDRDPLEQASTIPASWYVDGRIAELERESVFGGTWQVVARVDQFVQPGNFVTADLAGEPLVIVRGADGQLRAFYNVCRHHAAAVVTRRVRQSQHLSLSLSWLELRSRRIAQGRA